MPNRSEGWRLSHLSCLGMDMFRAIWLRSSLASVHGKAEETQDAGMILKKEKRNQQSVEGSLLSQWVYLWPRHVKAQYSVIQGTDGHIHSL